MNAFVTQGRVVDLVDAQDHMPEGDRAVTPSKPARPGRPLAQEDPVDDRAPAKERRQQ
jgi:hypothetical protein